MANPYKTLSRIDELMQTEKLQILGYTLNAYIAKLADMYYQIEIAAIQMCNPLLHAYVDRDAVINRAVRDIQNKQLPLEWVVDESGDSDSPNICTVNLGGLTIPIPIKGDTSNLQTVFRQDIRLLETLGFSISYVGCKDKKA